MELLFEIIIFFVILWFGIQALMVVVAGFAALLLGFMVLIDKTKALIAKSVKQLLARFYV